VRAHDRDVVQARARRGEHAVADGEVHLPEHREVCAAQRLGQPGEAAVIEFSTGSTTQPARPSLTAATASSALPQVSVGWLGPRKRRAASWL
jgi:hypothetical protein